MRPLQFEDYIKIIISRFRIKREATAGHDNAIQSGINNNTMHFIFLASLLLLLLQCMQIFFVKMRVVMSVPSERKHGDLTDRISLLQNCLDHFVLCGIFVVDRDCALIRKPKIPQNSFIFVINSVILE